MTRMNDLLIAAAAAFEDGRTLDHGFLVEHEVTFDELGALLKQLATGARMMADDG